MPTQSSSEHTSALVAPAILASLRLVDTDPAELDANAVVIGVYSFVASPGDRPNGEEPNPLLLASGAESIAVAFDGKLTDTLLLLGATGGVGEVTKVATLGTITAPLVVAVGLGPEPTGALPVTETLRRATAAATRALAGSGTIALALPVGDDTEGDTGDALRGIVEGALLGGYRFTGYKSKPTPANRKPVTARAGARARRRERHGHRRDRSGDDRGGGGCAYA